MCSSSCSSSCSFSSINCLQISLTLLRLSFISLSKSIFCCCLYSIEFGVNVFDITFLQSIDSFVNFCLSISWSNTLLEFTKNLNLSISVSYFQLFDCCIKSSLVCLICLKNSNSSLTKFLLWLELSIKVFSQVILNLFNCSHCISLSFVSSKLCSLYIFLQLSDVASLESLNSIIEWLLCVIYVRNLSVVSQDAINLIKSSLAVSGSLNLSQLCLKWADAWLVRRNQSLELCNLLWKLIGSSKLVDLTLQVTDVVIIILTRSKCTHGCHCKCSHKQRA